MLVKAASADVIDLIMIYSTIPNYIVLLLPPGVCIIIMARTVPAYFMHQTEIDANGII